VVERAAYILASLVKKLKDRRMNYWLLWALGSDIGILVVGLLFHGPYLKHIRLHHRPFWEDIQRRSPTSWRYFKGMPTTGMLVSTFIGHRDYKSEETVGFLWIGRLIVLLNLMHVIALSAVIVLGLLVVFS
jgi:hypothetical protein